MLTPTILAELRAAVGVDGLIIDRNQLQTYECDGLAVLRSLPAAVVLPRSTAQVQAVIHGLRPPPDTVRWPRRRDWPLRGCVARRSRHCG